MTENMFPNLWVRTAANHNKTLEAPHIIYVYSEKKQKTSAAKPSTFLSPPPPLIFVWPLEFHIWKLCPGVTSRLILVRVWEHIKGPHSESNMLRSIKHKALVVFVQ